MKESRGRPSENVEVKVKFTLDTTDVRGERIVYSFDRTRHASATVSTKIYALGPPNKPELKLNQKYIPTPVVVVFKSSNRKNAKTKMKIFKTRHLDDILTNPIPGISDKAEILEIGVGAKCITRYKKEYNL